MKVAFEGLDNVCLSGGADGADVQWGMCAGKFGHNVIHWSFHGHRSQAPETEVVRLNEDQLAEAAPAVKRAAKALSKHPPRAPFARNLIHRNYYQVAWANRVYAVATLKDNLVQGGTGWAVQMYLDRALDDPEFKPEAYVYCQEIEEWHQMVDGYWVIIEKPPVPHGLWAGIGSRDLGQAGKDAIRSLLNYVKPQVS